MNNEKTYKPMSASSISNSLSNKCKTRHQSKEKPSKLLVYPLTQPKVYKHIMQIIIATEKQILLSVIVEAQKMAIYKFSCFCSVLKISIFKFSYLISKKTFINYSHTFLYKKRNSILQFKMCFNKCLK